MGYCFYSTFTHWSTKPRVASIPDRVARFSVAYGQNGCFLKKQRPKIHNLSTVVIYIIGSQSAPYGAPGLLERNLGAPRAIRLLIKILTWLIFQLSKKVITALIKFLVGLRKLWSISSWDP